VRKEGIPGEVAILSAMQEHAIKGSHLVMLSPLLLREELSFGALGHRLTFLQVRLLCVSRKAKNSPKKNLISRHARRRRREMATTAHIPCNKSQCNRSRLDIRIARLHPEATGIRNGEE